MKKRALAALLWFYAGWYAGAIVAFYVGLPDAIGPLVGAAAAVVITVDPRGMIWNARRSARTLPRQPAQGAVRS